MAKTVKGKAEVVKTEHPSVKAFSEWQVWSLEDGEWFCENISRSKKGWLDWGKRCEGLWALIHITIPAIK